MRKDREVRFIGEPIAPEVLAQIKREGIIHDLQNALYFKLQQSAHFLLGRPPIRVIRFHLDEAERLMESIEAVENGAPI